MGKNQSKRGGPKQVGKACPLDKPPSDPPPFQKDNEDHKEKFLLQFCYSIWLPFLASLQSTEKGLDISAILKDHADDADADDDDDNDDDDDEPGAWPDLAR